MPIAPAVFSLGLWAPNLHFARPSEVDDVPAAWAVPAGVTCLARYGDSPAYGHNRVQMFQISGTDIYKEILSAATPPGMLCAAGTHTLRYAIDFRVFGVTGSGQEVRIELRSYDSDGAEIADSAQVLYRMTTPATEWTLRTGDVADIVVPANCAFHRYVIVMGRPDSGWPTVTIDLAFLGAGIWSASAGSYTMPQNIARDGSEPCVPIDEDDGIYQNDAGETRYFDTRAHVSARAGILNYDWLPDAAGRALLYAWQMNHSRSCEGAAVNPGGGRWPLLVIPNTPMWPNAMMMRFSARKFPLVHEGEWIQDYWAGPIGLVEQV